MNAQNNLPEDEASSYGGHKLSACSQIRMLMPANFEDDAAGTTYGLNETLSESYRTNWIRFELEGAAYALIPVSDPISLEGQLEIDPQGDSTSAKVWDATIGFVLTNSHPGGQVQFPAEEEALQLALQSDIAAKGSIEQLEVFALHRRNRWVEFASLAKLDLDSANELARKWRQAAFLEVKRGYVQVHSVSPEVEAGSYPVRLVRLAAKPCPMREGLEQQYVCKLWGGPWVSKSMTAAYNWRAFQERSVALLGCGPCGDGSKPIADYRGQAWTRGGPIGLHKLSVPSRHGRPVYGESLY